jgi:hypothetical protein
MTATQVRVRKDGAHWIPPRWSLTEDDKVLTSGFMSIEEALAYAERYGYSVIPNKWVPEGQNYP